MSVLSNWSIPPAEIPEAGKSFSRSATLEERQAVAAALNILDVTSLTCDLRVRPLRQGRYGMSGRIAAALAQACVVTLEPVTEVIDEPVDLEFWPADQIPGMASTAADEWVDPEAPDLPEPIEQGRIAIGRVVYEILATAIDPYPRKPGAALELRHDDEDKAAASPFAALAKLKQTKS